MTQVGPPPSTLAHAQPGALSLDHKGDRLGQPQVGGEGRRGTSAHPDGHLDTAPAAGRGRRAQKDFAKVAKTKTSPSPCRPWPLPSHAPRASSSKGGAGRARARGRLRLRSSDLCLNTCPSYK